MCIIDLVCAEQGVHGVVARQNEAGEVDEEFTPNVEEHQEEVESGQTENSVDLGDAGLPFEVIEHLVL